MRDGRRLIGVILGARSPANRSHIMASLLDQAFGGGEIIEVRDEEPATPSQAHVASLVPEVQEEDQETQARTSMTRVASSKAKVAAIRGGAFTRTALRSSAKVARGSTASPSRASVKMASAPAPVRVVESKKAPSSSAFKVASLSRASPRFPGVTARAGTSGMQQAAKGPSSSEKKLVAAKPVPKARAVPAKPLAASAKSAAQLKTTDGPRPSAGRIAKPLSVPAKSKLRVAEGERRRSS
jgi:D-alanyl-D-alanine carboxypeptidase